MTKIKANASKHKAMSYERMKKREAELKAEVACMLAAAEAQIDPFGRNTGKSACLSSNGSDRMTVKLLLKVCSVAALVLLVFLALGPAKWATTLGTWL